VVNGGLSETSRSIDAPWVPGPEYAAWRLTCSLAYSGAQAQPNGPTELKNSHLQVFFVVVEGVAFFRTLVFSRVPPPGSRGLQGLR
jgi:hypothetical protein